MALAACNEVSDEWVKNRSRTLKMFMALNFLSGVETSLVFVTVTFYLKELHTPTNSIHWLIGVIIAADHFGEILGLFIVPPIADKWGCIRRLVLFTNTAIIIGNLIYSLHIHPFLLIAGRFLCGFGAISVSFQTGEIARCYDHQSVDAALTKLSGAFAIGFVIGPACNYAFKYVSFNIGQWYIGFPNSPSFFMALVYIIAQIFSYFMISDLYKDYIGQFEEGYDEIYRIWRYKGRGKTLEESEGYDDTKDVQSEKSENDVTKITKTEDLGGMSSYEKSGENWKQMTILLIGSLSTCWIIIGSGIISCVLMSFFIWMQLIAVEILHFGSMQLISCYCGLSIVSISSVLVFPLLEKFMRDIVLMLGTICLLINASCCLLVLPFFKAGQAFIQLLLFALFIVSFGVAFNAECVTLKCILAKRVEASVQCTAEGVRAAASRIGFLLGGLLAGMTFHIFYFICIAFILALSIVLCVVVYTEYMKH